MRVTKGNFEIVPVTMPRPVADYVRAHLLSKHYPTLGEAVANMVNEIVRDDRAAHEERKA